MTLKQIQNVNSFSIENEFGKIDFIGDTDLTDVDLSDIVTIE